MASLLPPSVHNSTKDAEMLLYLLPYFYNHFCFIIFQIEVHVFNYPKELIDYCNGLGIQIVVRQNEFCFHCLLTLVNFGVEA